MLTAGRNVHQLADIPRMYFEVQNLRPDNSQYDVSVTGMWLSVPGELNENVLKFLSGKELIRFKSVSKSAKSAYESKRGKIFNRIGEQLDKIIKDRQLRSVPNENKFKVKNWLKFGP
jgi:hypothetical protein